MIKSFLFLIAIFTTFSGISQNELVMESLKTLSGKWEAAENAEAEKIDHELVVSWGFKGC